MANLLSIAELFWRSMNPQARSKTGVTREEVISTAKNEYAAAMWIYRQEQIASDGSFDMPSDLLTESPPMEVKNDEIDISSLKYLSALPGNLWLQNVGGLNCDCRYVKSTLNLSQILCDDDSLPENHLPYYVLGKKIKFPKGTHKKELPIVYANTGTGLDPDVIEVNEYVASKVRLKLMQLYGQEKQVDDTNNQTPNN